MKLICTLFIQEQCEFHIKLSFHKSTLFSAIFEPGRSPGSARKNLNGYQEKVVPKNLLARRIGAHTRAHLLADVPLVACVQTPVPSGN